MLTLVVGILATLVAVFGYMWQAQSTGGIAWGRQIWVVLAFGALSVPGLGFGIGSVMRSRRKILAASGMALICGSGLALYLLFS